MLTVADALELAPLKQALPEVLVGSKAALGREVRWSHVLDLPDAQGLLEGGELVLANGVGLGASAAIQREFVRQLYEQDAAALAIELGLEFREQLPTPLVEEARAVGLPLIVLHRKSRFVEITKAVHYEITGHQLPLLRGADELAGRLTDMMLHGLGAGELLDEVARVAGNPLVLEDAAHELVGYARLGVDDRALLTAWGDLVAAERQHIAPTRGHGSAPIRLLDHSWGRLVLLQFEGPIDEAAELALARGADALSLHLLSKAREEALGARSRGALLDDLAAGRVSATDAAARAVALGFARNASPIVPVAAAWRTGGDNGRELAGNGWNRLIPDLKTAFAAASLGTLVGPREQDLLLIVHAPVVEGVEHGDRVAQAFGRVLARHGLGVEHVALAIGRPHASWAAVGRGLAWAARAAGAATAEPPRPWFDAGRVTVREFLYGQRESPLLLEFIEQQLGPLLGGPGDRKAGELLQTLDAYVQHGGSKARTARSLHIERQSLYHRLERIERALGVSLDDSDTLLSLHLASRALRQLRSLSSDRAHPPESLR